MTLTKLQSLLKEARLARNANAVNALGAAISDIQYTQARLGEFDETQILTSIRKTRDVFQEEIDGQERLLATTPEKTAKVAELTERRDLLTSLLPEVFNESATGRLASVAIIELGATTAKDMGKVIAKLKADYGLRIDAALASRIVKGLLTGTYKLEVRE